MHSPLPPPLLPPLRLLPLVLPLLLPLAAAPARAQISPLPGQVPSWPASYLMNASSFVMLCASDGLMPRNRTDGWSIVDVDWSNAKRQWAASKPMNAEELLLQQAALIKASSPSTRVFVYRNSIKALPWFSTVREKLEDPQYAAWFLPFACNGTSAEERALGGGGGASSGDGCDGAPPSCTLVADEDYAQGASGPLPVVPAGTPAECCAACGNFSGCWAATFFSGSCYMKTQAQTEQPVECGRDGCVGCWPPGRTPPPPPPPRCHVSKCDQDYDPPLCSALYHDHEQTPGFPSGDGDCAAPACDTGGVPAGEYLFNFLAVNTSVNGQTLRDWLLDDYLFGPTGGGSDLVDGFFWDDQWEWNLSGPTEMDGHVVQDLGLSAAQLLAHTAAYNETQRIIFAETIRRGRFAWQMFALTARDPQYNPTDGPLVHKATCSADLRTFCAAGAVTQTNAIIYASSGEVAQDLASFLLVRGDYAWLGTGWAGCDNYPALPAYEDDYGVPLELCRESAPGSNVFVREWSRATVSMNCSSWTPSIVLK